MIPRLTSYLAVGLLSYEPSGLDHLVPSAPEPTNSSCSFKVNTRRADEQTTMVDSPSGSTWCAPWLPLWRNWAILRGIFDSSRTFREKPTQSLVRIVLPIWRSGISESLAGCNCQSIADTCFTGIDCQSLYFLALEKFSLVFCRPSTDRREV